VTRDVLVGHLGAPLDSVTTERPAHGPAVAPAGVEALDRLVHALELSRYARSGAEVDPADLRTDAAICLSALAGGAPRSARRRADWWPRSVLSFLGFGPRPAPATSPTVEARYGGVVDHIG
jgi:hypothetical protein